MEPAGETQPNKSPSEDGQIAVIPIRYDGLDASAHEMDLLSLGQSLQGVARILGVVGHFATTLQYAKQQQALSVRVMARPPRDGCVTVDSIVQVVSQHQLLSGGGVIAIGAIVRWIIGRASGRKEEMKALKDSLDKSIALLAGQNSGMVERLTATIEKMAESLRPSLVAAVTPVGKTCRTLQIGADAIIDEPTAEAIRAERADEVTDSQEWTVLVTELDVEQGTAKVRLPDEGDEGRRYRAQITDPAFAVSGNSYTAALGSQSPLRVIAKATLREGEIQTLFISDTAPGA